MMNVWPLTVDCSGQEVFEVHVGDPNTTEETILFALDYLTGGRIRGRYRLEPMKSFRCWHGGYHCLCRRIDGVSP